MNNLDISLLQHELPDLTTTSQLNWFDNSRLENFTKCPRFSFYSDQLGLDFSNAKMNAGTVFHHAIEEGKEGRNSEIALVRKWTEFERQFREGEPKFAISRFHEVLCAYNNFWASPDKLQINSIAREFSLAWRYAPENFWLIGRSDEIAIHEGKFWAVERKTCGGIRPDYIGDKNVSNQRLQYLWILMQIIAEKGLNPRDYIGGMIFDVIGWTNSKVEFARWLVRLPGEPTFKEWFKEIREKIAHYRESVTEFESMIKMPTKRRAQCHIYGKCAFLNLCDAWELTDSFEPPAIIQNYRKKNWIPF
jgi:hypothetical protein